MPDNYYVDCYRVCSKGIAAVRVSHRDYRADDNLFRVLGSARRLWGRLYRDGVEKPKAEPRMAVGVPSRS